MSTGDCPSCRAPVDFKPGAGKVKVCEYCNTVVLKGQAKLESLGKVADLVDTQSPLKVGLSGNYSGAPFTVAGRVQKANATGTWDEWYLAFDDGRQGWLSESEGDWNLSFPVGAAPLPKVEELKPLLSFQLRGTRFVVEEKAEATTTSAQGQLPEFNAQHVYVDATGPKGVFCTLDQAEGSAEAFVGHRVNLLALGFDRNELVPTPKKAQLSQARCTNCNGMLELKAPDATKRVGCPFCGALLDVRHGELAFLQLLEKPPYEPLLPLGRVGQFDGADWTVLAFLIRSCTVEGTRYAWDEFLLYNAQRGFVWLMQANGHWTWLVPSPAGELSLNAEPHSITGVATYAGKSYKVFQSVFARTDYVVGECYWTASVGELARATEYVLPEEGLSVNLDEVPGEATVTLGKLIPAEAVQAAFKLPQALPAVTGKAPAQPNPFKAKAKSTAVWSGIWSAVLFVLFVVFSAKGSSAQYLDERFSVPPGVAPGSPEVQRFSSEFRIDKKVPLEVGVDAPGLNNNWLGVSVDLVNVQTGEVIAVYAEPSYYAGVTDGESWSEGSSRDSKQTDDVEPGTYLVRVTPTFDPGREVDYRVTVRADSKPGFCCPYAIFLLLLVVPAWNWLRSSSFETERWNESVFQYTPTTSIFPHAKGDDDDDSSDWSSDDD